MPLTPEDVRNKQFTTVRLREGYDEDEVDAFLDEVEAELTRLLRENEDLRAKLAAATRAAAQNQQQQACASLRSSRTSSRQQPSSDAAAGHARCRVGPVPAGISGPPQQQQVAPWVARPSCRAVHRSCPPAPVARAARRVRRARWARAPVRWARARCSGPMGRPDGRPQARWAARWAAPGWPAGSGPRWRQRRPCPLAGPADRRPGDRRGPFRGQQDRRRGASAVPRAWSGTPAPRPTRWSGTRRRSTASRWAPWSPPAPRWSARSRTCAASSASTARV